MVQGSRTRVQSVTTAHAGRHDDIATRERRYLVMMAIRVACLPPAVFVEGWARWIFIAGVVILPYVAVVIANAVTRPAEGTLTPVEPVPKAALPAGPEDARDSPSPGPSRH